MPGALDHSPSDVVRHLLIDLGAGMLPASGSTWPVFVGHEPDEPDEAITIYDTTGILQGRTQFDGEVQERHGIQIRVRANGHTTGFAKARDIAVTLDEDAYQETVTIGTSTYLVHALSRESGPLAAGKEVPTSKRDIFTVNYTVVVRQQ